MMAKSRRPTCPVEPWSGEPRAADVLGWQIRAQEALAVPLFERGAHPVAPQHQGPGFPAAAPALRPDHVRMAARARPSGNPLQRRHAAPRVAGQGLRFGSATGYDSGMSIVRCDHEYQPTGYIQTSMLDNVKSETEEFKCQNCPKRLWLKRGTTPPTSRRSSLRANAVQLPGQLSLLL